MKRWAFWLLLGFGTYVVFTFDSTLRHGKPSPVQSAMSLAFLFWAWITALAVPISLVVWLVRGTRRADP